jgi:hypothetical protein
MHSGRRLSGHPAAEELGAITLEVSEPAGGVAVLLRASQSPGHLTCRELGSAVASKGPGHHGFEFFD